MYMIQWYIQIDWVFLSSDILVAFSLQLKSSNISLDQSLMNQTDHQLQLIIYNFKATCKCSIYIILCYNEQWRLLVLKEDFWCYWVFNIEFILGYRNIIGENAENMNSIVKSPCQLFQDSQKHSPFPSWKQVYRESWWTERWSLSFLRHNWGLILERGNKISKDRLCWNVTNWLQTKMWGFDISHSSWEFCCFSFYIFWMYFS